jgi:hypothetical protein
MQAIASDTHRTLCPGLALPRSSAGHEVDGSVAMDASLAEFIANEYSLSFPED